MSAPEYVGPIFVDPVFKERVWGGSSLIRWYGDLLPEGSIGEAWAISGMPGDSGTVTDGPGAGGTLDQAWRAGLVTGEPRDDDFPILLKFLDTHDWLSVQVHPDDDQARVLEGQPRGKAECWYIVECDPGAELILGHDLESTTELAVALSDGRLDEHLLRQQVAPGSFFVVPAGSVHAVGPGMLLCEVQQSSDITYRLYDFDRPGLDGKPRPLHIEKAFAVVRAPFDLADSLTADSPHPVIGGRQRTLVDGPEFRVSELRVNGQAPIGSDSGYRLLATVSGAGQLIAGGRSHRLGPGTCAVLPVGCADAVVSGGVVVLLTDPIAE